MHNYTCLVDVSKLMLIPFGELFTTKNNLRVFLFLFIKVILGHPSSKLHSV